MFCVFSRERLGTLSRCQVVDAETGRDPDRLFVPSDPSQCAALTLAVVEKEATSSTRGKEGFLIQSAAYKPNKGGLGKPERRHRNFREKSRLTRNLNALIPDHC